MRCLCVGEPFLTGATKQIFGILAKHQIVASSDEDYTPGSSGAGMSYAMLYQESCNYLFVTNELTFRTLLTEFKDHKIMVAKKGSDGADMLEIPLDVDALISLVEDMSL
jgi:origin recognition complex subunit 2